uniref:2'-phosphotransferase n=1 Tax=Saccoglossus kowalevskii TaxID=10224 RepID=A0ABM0MM63_SACKO|nr:PREDICTED: uncharacterized protein LOC102803698 [Saccoglossus kowalevskii]
MQNSNGTPNGSAVRKRNSWKSSGQGDREFIDESRLSKRLSYLLRYGAEKEGLAVSDKGFIDLKMLLGLTIMQSYSEEEIINEIRVSRSTRGHKRFEFKREYGGQVFVRALFGRKMERNPYHRDSKVYRLLELCLVYICDHVDHFDLQDFPDEFLQSTIIHKLIRQKKLSNNAMKCMLGSSIEELDLEGVYLTAKSLKIIAERCNNLKRISLQNCGYLMNDQIFIQMIKITYL